MTDIALPELDSKAPHRSPSIHCWGCNDKVNVFFWYRNRSLCQVCLDEVRNLNPKVKIDMEYREALRKHKGIR